MTPSPAFPSGSACALSLTFDVDAESAILAMGRRYAAHAMVMSHQAYGPRVGVPRLMDLLDDFGLAATFFVPGLVAERYPGLVDGILARGHEIGHHSYSHRKPTTLTSDEERRDFERALDVLRGLGAEPKGHRTALWAASWRSQALVAEHDLLYDSSLMDDDRPYRLATESGSVMELPPHWSLDDWEQYGYLEEPHIGTRIEPPDHVFSLWRAELDAMRRYGSLFMLTNHPFLSGRPSRVENLRRLIEHILSCGDVEILTCAEIADRAAADASLPTRTHAPGDYDPDTYPEL